MKRVDLAAVAVEATSGAPLVVLREQDEPHRLLPIFVGAPEAAAIAVAVSGEAPPRPLTHDVMVALIQSLDGSLDAVEVTELSEGSFLARIALHGPTGEQRVDTRPSDAIALAVRLGTPLFVSEAVLDEAGTLPPEPAAAPTIDEAAIDEEVEAFRTFLEDADVSDFAAGDDQEQ